MSNEVCRLRDSASQTAVNADRSEADKVQRKRHKHCRFELRIAHEAPTALRREDGAPEDE
jgi:hypothetical protein